MNDTPGAGTPLYDYSDPRVKQAGYAAIIYGVISLASALFALLKARLDAMPASAVVMIVYGVIMAGISGALGYGIFRRSKIAVILMIIFVLIPQLYTWLVAHSIAGSLVSIVVTAFLARGAKAIFEPPDEEKPRDLSDTTGGRIR